MWVTIFLIYDDKEYYFSYEEMDNVSNTLSKVHCIEVKLLLLENEVNS